MAKLKKEEEKETSTASPKDGARIGVLVSGASHPVTVSYGGSTIMIPPKGRARKVNQAKLGTLPQSVSFIPNK